MTLRSFHSIYNVDRDVTGVVGGTCGQSRTILTSLLLEPKSAGYHTVSWWVLRLR